MELILSSPFESCHFFFSLGSFSTSCIFLLWDVYPEETEQNFSYNLASFDLFFGTAELRVELSGFFYYLQLD